MNKLALVLLSLFVFSCAGAQHNSSEITNVNAVAFKKLVDAGNGIVLDVRTPEECAEGTIANASTIDFYAEDFKQKINLINKDKEIYVYCRSGGRSAKAAAILAENGFKKVYNLEGGITAWKENGFPVTPPTAQADDKIKGMTIAEFNALLNSGKPLLADFHTKWCAPCRQMAPIVDKLALEYQDKINVVRIDVDNSQELSESYSIKSVPVFILFKNGKETWRKTGSIPESELRDAMEK